MKQKGASKSNLSAAVKERVRRATVRFTRMGGRGVLVPGGIILTAAHCIGWNADGSMVLDSRNLEQLVNASGKKLLVDVTAVEPVADIAAVEGPDNQEFFKEAVAYDAF